jgi:hypothetical protein
VAAPINAERTVGLPEKEFRPELKEAQTGLLQLAVAVGTAAAPGITEPALVPVASGAVARMKMPENATHAAAAGLRPGGAQSLRTEPAAPVRGRQRAARPSHAGSAGAALLPNAPSAIPAPSLRAAGETLYAVAGPKAMAAAASLGAPPAAPLGITEPPRPPARTVSRHGAGNPALAGNLAGLGWPDPAGCAARAASVPAASAMVCDAPALPAPLGILMVPEETLGEGALPASTTEAEPAEDVPPLFQRLMPVFAGRSMAKSTAAPRSAARFAAPVWTHTRESSTVLPRAGMVPDQADGSGPRRAAEEQAPKKWEGRWLPIGSPSLPGRRFWRHAPADLKWAALALPVILVLVVYSMKAPQTAPQAASKHNPQQSNTGSLLATQFAGVKKAITQRAAVKLYDDFHGGLGAWQGAGEWAKTWTYGEAGFLEPGHLGLYTPTLRMKDYSLDFLGQIARKSLNWVFRASDERNYYAMRIVVTRTGPQPVANIVRYAVIDGKEEAPVSLPIPFPIRSDTLYRVRMEVHGSNFSTYIQGQVVDSFSDSRLKTGGVGFYTPKGDRSQLSWVEVVNQYDFIGRMCALLAPYQLQAEAGSAE